MRQGPTRAWIRTILTGVVFLALSAAACGEVPNDGTRPSGRTLCGASFDTKPGETTQQALERADNYYGGLDMVRIFYADLPDPWPGKLHTNGRPLVVSFKARPGEILAGTHDTTFRNWFATAPRDQHIYWSYYHEPEEDISAGKFSARRYRKAWAHLRTLADTADNPRLHATLILMSWSLDPGSGRDWRKYYPGSHVIQVLGWDTYNRAADEGRYQDPVEMYARTIATSEAEGLPFGIAETGSHLVPGDHGERRAAWLRAMTHHLTDAGALWVAYFDLDWKTGDYRLSDAPSREAWSNFC